MATEYTVLVVGTGKRGKHHATAFNDNPRFKVTGLCDLDEARLKEAAEQIGGDVKTGTDGAALALELKPDIFCFCTMPNLRVPMIQAAIDAGSKLVAFEKPVALTSAESMQIRDMLKPSGMKGVVSHQHRYGEHYQKVKDIVAGGALGRIHTVYGMSPGWMTHMLSHMIDYTRWFNDNVPAQWAMGQAAGHSKFTDNHPSPDYIAGFVQFENGVRGIYEVGAGAPDQPEVEKWWGKNRIGAQGTDGFAEVLTHGGWRALTKRDGYQEGGGVMNYALDMPPYVQEMADWLDDDAKVHQNSFESAYAGAEIVFALQRSAAEGGQVALPLTEGADEQALLKAKLPQQKVLLGAPIHAAEFDVS